MRALPRILLTIVGAVSPLVIAACYGPRVGYLREGRVTDKLTHAAVAGIQVSCGRGEMQARALTGPDGRFAVGGSCQQVEFTDVDGATGGAYQDSSVPAQDIGEVELAPVDH